MFGMIGLKSTKDFLEQVLYWVIFFVIQLTSLALMYWGFWELWRWISE